LSREEVVDAALEVAAERGVEGVTMRVVGEALGVSAMALYNHVRNKDDLIDLLVRRVMSLVDPLVLAEDGWEAGLRRFMLSELREQARYPGLSGVMISRPLLGAGPNVVQRGVQFFEDAGFKSTEARLAWAFAQTYLHGRLSVEAHLRGVEPGEHRFPGFTSRNYIEYGVDAVIEGIRTLSNREEVRRVARPRGSAVVRRRSTLSR
jgi:AcrR family transcriptional regulator